MHHDTEVCALLGSAGPGVGDANMDTYVRVQVLITCVCVYVCVWLVIRDFRD